MERTGFEQWKPREVARLLALVETERRYYQEMMAALPTPLVVLAHDRAILSANLAFRRLVGMSGEELRKRTIDQILPSDDLVERLRSAHVYGDTAPFFIDMGERRFRMAAAPIRGWQDDMEPETLLLVETLETMAEGSGQAVQTATTEPAVTHPIATQPVVTHDAVVDLAPTVASLPSVVWLADASTFAFSYVGGAWAEILGYPPAQWLAEPSFCSERIHPEDRSEVMALYRATAQKGGEASAEFRAFPEGSVDAVWCRETIRVPAPQDGPRLVSGVLSLIGERRQLEAQALTAARVDALRDLSSRLAHDLNNPLMIVTGYSEEVMHALPEGDPMRNDLGEVLSASERLTDLAGHLLSFARPLAKTPSKVDLKRAIAELKSKLKGVIDLELVTPDGELWAFADDGQLDEAIDAFAAYAIENTAEVSRLRVACQAVRIAERLDSATLPPGGYSRLDIQAVGKSAGPSAKVFESILAKDSQTPDGPAVARAYLNIRHWGGDVAFVSRAGNGSTFTVFLPHAEPDKAPGPARVQQVPEIVVPPIAEASPVAAPEAQVQPPLGTVLVVEDEPGIRNLVRKILTRERYEVLDAGSGEDALKVASEHRGAIGLVLTDVMLPGMSGRQLAQTLAAERAGLKVVYISGFTEDESVRAGQYPPGSLFLQKPFTLSSLVSAVTRAFEETRN